MSVLCGSKQRSREAEIDRVDKDYRRETPISGARQESQ
jgi:hypothetical protein